jgi:hypothetical protein
MGYLSNQLSNVFYVLHEGELRGGQERANEQSLVAVYGICSLTLDNVLTWLYEV